jgi:hypothetical protein
MGKEVIENSSKTILRICLFLKKDFVMTDANVFELNFVSPIKISDIVNKFMANQIFESLLKIKESGISNSFKLPISSNSINLFYFMKYKIKILNLKWALKTILYQNSLHLYAVDFI